MPRYKESINKGARSRHVTKVAGKATCAAAGVILLLAGGVVRAGNGGKMQHKAYSRRAAAGSRHKALNCVL